MKGTIKFYNDSKGFGFIRCKGHEVFFHISNCRFKDITVGEAVVFRTKMTVKGVKAIEVIKNRVVVESKSV